MSANMLIFCALIKLRDRSATGWRFVEHAGAPRSASKKYRRIWNKNSPRKRPTPQDLRIYNTVLIIKTSTWSPAGPHHPPDRQHSIAYFRLKLGEQRTAVLKISETSLFQRLKFPTREETIESSMTWLTALGGSRFFLGRSPCLSFYHLQGEWTKSIWAESAHATWDYLWHGSQRTRGRSRKPVDFRSSGA